MKINNSFDLKELASNYGDLIIKKHNIHVIMGNGNKLDIEELK